MGVGFPDPFPGQLELGLGLFMLMETAQRNALDETEAVDRYCHEVDFFTHLRSAAATLSH